MEKERSNLIKSMVEATGNLRIGKIRQQEYIIYDNIIEKGIENTNEINELEK